MILIIDEGRTKRASTLRIQLEMYGIPSVIVSLDVIRDYPEFLLAVVFADSEKYLSLASVRLGKCHLIAVNGSGSRIYNNDAVFCDIGDRVSDFVINYMKDALGIDHCNLTAGDISITSESVRAGLAFMKLTATERRILSLLVLMKDRWISENTVYHACFSDSGRKRSDKVSVHICNLNKKGRAYTGWPLILCKRGVGYTLNLNT